jgi:hypothetical protein
MTNFFLGLLRALKLPLNLLKGLVRKRKKRNSNERERKQLKHVRNFSVRNYSWKKGLVKNKRRKKGKTNNSKG